MNVDLDKIKIQTDFPIIARIKDDLYPYEGYDHIRQTARALAENEEGKLGFLHIVGEDLFGERDHLESCGGGIEENEGVLEALEREVAEEMGYTFSEYEMVGCVLDAYNLIGRITLSTYMHVKVDTRHPINMNRTDEEKILINEILWLDPLDALDWLENRHPHKVDKLVQRREAAALRYYLESKHLI